MRGTPAVIMIGRTIEPTMMMPPSPESDGEEHARRSRKSPSEQRQRPLAAELCGEVDDGARDAGLDRHAAEQRAEDHRHVDRRETARDPR